MAKEAPTARRLSHAALLKVSTKTKVDKRKALVVLRKGNAIDRTKVLDKEFEIELEEIGRIKVATKLIKTIILNNPPNFPLDVIRFVKGNEISGKVLTKSIHIESEEIGGGMEIPMAKVLSIVWPFS
jgi:hypothetical protein